MTKASYIYENCKLYGEAFAFNAAVGFLQSLDVDRASAISGAIWRNIAPFTIRHKRAIKHMQMAMPELSESDISKYINEMWDNLGRTTAESLHMHTLISQKERFIINDETLEAFARAKVEGGIFVSLHLGNWELAAPILQRFGIPAGVVYQTIKNPLIEEKILKMRAPFYPLGIYSKGNEAAKNMLRIVRSKKAIAIMGDLRDLSGIYVPFFSQLAPSNVFPAMLARSCKVPLFVGSIFREKGATFKVVLKEITFSKTNDREEDYYNITKDIQARFEEFIREAPGQWMWGHRRWGR